MTNKIDLSPIFDVYSMREQPTGETTRALTPEFKNRVRLFCEEMVHPYDHHSEAGYKIAGFWMTLRDKLRYRHGLIHLADRNRYNPVEEVRKFLSECSDEHYLDFIAMFFQSEDLAECVTDDELQEAVDNINKFFELDDLPYILTGFAIVRPPAALQIGGMPSFMSPPPPPIKPSKIEEYPQIIRRDSDILHETAIEPTLTLLSLSIFASANEEFLDALKDFRDGDYGDCVVKCGSSLESVMKVICDQKGWPYQQTDAAAKLLNEILPRTSLDTFFEQPIMLIATIRNRLGKAHGAGTQQKTVSKHVASYVINATASAILLLVEETKP